MDRERESFFFHLLVLKIGFKGQVFFKDTVIVKSPLFI